MAIFRLLQVAIEFARFGVWICLQNLHPPRARESGSERLCATLSRLGVTFVKFGQALSLRQDILPPAYVAALESLQDRVPPFPARDALREIERGLGQPVNRLFAHFERTPLAAASVAQVHAARLHDGREVIVKVRRLGLPAQIDRDLRALQLLVGAVSVVMPRLKRYRPGQIIEEIWRNLRKELDFRQEARNIRRFSAAFADWPGIRVPQVVDELVSEAVIVQEHSSGRRIDDPTLSPQGPQLAQTFVEAYLHQFFVLGVFHGDPHPGNLFIMADGRICFHDFGLVGVLDGAARRRLAAFTNAFIRQDPEWLFDAAIDLGIFAGELDRAAFTRSLSEIMADYAALPLKEWSLAEAFLRVTRVGQAQNVFIPHELLVLMRAMFLIEHVVRVLDPEFRLLETLTTKGSETLQAALAGSSIGGLDRLKHDLAAALQETPALVAAWLRQVRREGNSLGNRVGFSTIKQLEEHVDRSSNRLTLALVTLGLYIAGSLLMQHSIGPRLYGELPALAALAYGLAAWFTLRLVRAIGRAGQL